MNDELKTKWAAAFETPNKRIEIGDLVVCDQCSRDYTNSSVSGGFIFNSNAVCPVCAPQFEAGAKRYGEEHMIRARCPVGVSFQRFVVDYRNAHGSNYIEVSTP